MYTNLNHISSQQQANKIQDMGIQLAVQENHYHESHSSTGIDDSQAAAVRHAIINSLQNG